MADPPLQSSATEMNQIFLDGLICPYELYVADSKMPGARYGLFVREEVPAGKEIFRAAEPAVSAVESAVDACDNCFAWTLLSDPFKNPVALLNCASCKAVRYCSKNCQRAAWKGYHKEECKIYCEINTRYQKAQNLSSPIRMLIRLVVLHQNARIPENQWQAILTLESHKALMQQSNGLDWAAIDADIRLVKETTMDELSENDLSDLLWRIKINEHSMGSPMQPMLGSCLVPGAALINHSCYPNAHHLSEGPELVFRSCRRIAKNDEITISYIDPTKSYKERQEALFTAYAFICQCSRCSEGFEEQGEMFTGDDIVDAPIRLARSQLDDLLTALVYDKQELRSVEASVQQICNSQSSGKPWPINATPIPSIYVTLAERLDEKQQWKEALHHWLRIVYVIDPLRYPDRLNPHRVENLMSLTQSEMQIGHESQRDSAVKASFSVIATELSKAQYSHNTRLQEDAAASLGTDHLIFKAADHYVKALYEQMVTLRGESFRESEEALLKWAGVNLTTHVM